MRKQAETAWRNACKIELEKLGLDSAAKEFNQCGDVYGVLACSNDHRHFQALAVHTCKLRFCPQCARKVGQRLVSSYLPKLKAATRGAKRSYTFKVINLTTDISLDDPQIIEKTKRMYRMVSLFFDNVLGEGKPGWAQKSSKHYTGEGYLVASEFGSHCRKLHFHCVFFGRYIPQATLSDNWQGLTGYPIVHVSKVKEGLKKGLKEVLKYVTKFDKKQQGDHAGFPEPKMIAQLANVYNNMRRIRTRGLFYNLPDENAVTDAITNENPVACPECFARLVTFDPVDWNMQHPDMRCDLLHLKRENKFLKRGNSPPGKYQTDRVSKSKSPVFNMRK